jgi:hypothetical protein
MRVDVNVSARRALEESSRSVVRGVTSDVVYAAYALGTSWLILQALGDRELAFGFFSASGLLEKLRQ